MNLRQTLSRRTLSRLALLGVFVAAPFGPAVAAGADHHAEAVPVVAPHTTPLGLGGYSPVSYFAEGGPHVGSPAIAAEHAGVVYFFASEAERDTFNATPERYTPAYGGWCATGMALGQYFPVDPTSYKIVDNRLMLFLQSPEADALQMWNDADEAAQIEKADAFFKAESMGDAH